MISFANDSTSGMWRGEVYEITLSDTWDEIEGHWGDIKYDIDVSETFNDIEGTIDGEKIDIDVSATFKEVSGILPCGKVDYEYSLTFKEISGEICGNEFEIDFDDEGEVIPMFKSILMQEILSYFPRPAKRKVRRFIMSRIQFVKP